MRPVHFSLEELVPSAMIEGKGHLSPAVLWSMIDDRILFTLDALREQFGPIIINDWSFGGRNQYCGLRPWNCGIGARYSQHKFGRAVDCIFKDTDVERVRQGIINTKNSGKDRTFVRYITCIEADVPWLHFDVRNNGQPGILIINP